MSSIQTKLEALRRSQPRLVIETDTQALAARARDWWMRSLLLERRGEMRRPGAILRPGSAEEVAGALAWAAETDTAVVPYGLGSGVCGAIAPEGDQVVLDLGRLDKILELNDTSLTVTVQPGMRGSTFEEELRRRGYTMGHFPQSIALSSVGGWCATRASGQYSTLYGNIEDMLLGCQVVLAGGRTIRLPAVPRSATGPDLRALFLGSEGTLGVFTELTFRIHALPESSRGRAYTVPSMDAGIEALRKILRAGWRPAVTRLSDATEAGRHFQAAAGGLPVLLLLSEGAAARVDVESAATGAIVEAEGGDDIGEEPVASWLAHRNDVPTFDQLVDQGLVVDTIEVAAGWDRLGDLYREAVEAVSGIEGILVMSAHVSHCYTQGANLYFTFVGAHQSDYDRALAIYDAAWDATMRVTHAIGGTIAHHHGIGRVRKQWLARELGAAHDVLVTLKKALDPKGILNPGTLVDVE